MRLADAILRRGHLSEQALLEALLVDERPEHLDRCDVCAERALAFARWLDGVRSTGIEMADERFAPEQLKVQRDQILRRLEQLDEGPRVIAFPGLNQLAFSPGPARRVAPAWLGVAAAAGLVLGIIGGQLTARIGPAFEARPSGTTAATDSESRPTTVPAIDLLDLDLERPPSALSEMDGLFPPLTLASNVAGG